MSCFGEFYDGRPYPVFCKSLDENAGQYEKSDCRRSGRIRAFLPGGNFAAAVGITMAVLHMLVSSGMVVCGLKIRSFSEFLKCYILLYFVSVLIGGILGMLKPYVKYTSLYFAVVIGCYYTIRAVWEFLCRLQKEELKLCRIILYQEGSCCEIRGLWDTGNVLKDPLSEKPVCILEQSTIEKLTGEKENLKGFRLIPYRTVGKSGVMPVFELEKMYIVQKKQWIYHPLVGICEEQISEQGMYQMIINLKY